MENFIVYLKMAIVPKLDETGKPILDQQGNPVMVTPYLSYVC